MSDWRLYPNPKADHEAAAVALNAVNRMLHYTGYNFETKKFEEYKQFSNFEKQMQNLKTIRML